MAQHLWLLRHGDAEPHGSREDAERRLTDRGERQSRLAGQALSRLGLGFDAAFTSPRVRSLETARLACRALGCEAVVHDALSAGFDHDDLEELLAGHGDSATILLVGHEPDFSQLVHDLTGGRVDMKKGGVAGLRVERRAGELIALLRPVELRRIAG